MWHGVSPSLSGAATRYDENRADDLLRLLRPHLWVKSALVFVGLIFGRAWETPELVAAALLAALAFSLAASAGYIINDFADLARDRLHPHKRHRPLAAGRIGPPTALALAVLLLLASGCLADAAGPAMPMLIAIYVAISLAYSYGLKHVALLKVVLVAAGIMLRLLAGTLGIGIQPSQWLLLCGTLLALFLGCAKWRMEIAAPKTKAPALHTSLLDAKAQILDILTSTCAGAAVVSFCLYTLNPGTVFLHGTKGLVYTVPFVVYGVCRYLYLLLRPRADSEGAGDMTCDSHLLVAAVGWALSAAMVIVY